MLGIHHALTRRLINVALSRAKARLVVSLSRGDLANESLAQVKALMKFDCSGKTPVPLSEILRSERHAKDSKPATVSHGNKIYQLEGFDPSGKVLLREHATGLLKKFNRAATLATTEVKVVSVSPGLLAPAAPHNEQMLAELARLRAENAALKQREADGRISLKISDKGAVSAYGLGRFPVTLYMNQWQMLLSMKGDIEAFIMTNKSALKSNRSGSTS